MHRPRYKDWSWPKGKLDPDESLPAAAVREVAEEIGSPVVLGAPLPGLRYTLADGRTKSVHYWAAEVAGPDDAVAVHARGRSSPRRSEEIDDVVWVSAATAAQMLTRKADQAVLTALTRMRERGRLTTRLWWSPATGARGGARRGPVGRPTGR